MASEVRAIARIVALTCMGLPRTLTRSGSSSGRNRDRSAAATSLGFESATLQNEDPTVPRETV